MFYEFFDDFGQRLRKKNKSNISYDPYKTQPLDEINLNEKSDVEYLQESIDEESILDNRLNSENSNNLINQSNH